MNEEQNNTEKTATEESKLKEIWTTIKKAAVKIYNVTAGIATKTCLAVYDWYNKLTAEDQKFIVCVVGFILGFVAAEILNV